MTVDVLSGLMEQARNFIVVEGLTVGRENTEITHLQFADDTISSSLKIRIKIGPT